MSGMRIAIKNVGRKKRHLYIDGKLACAARDIHELEAQVRITKMLSEMNDVQGTLS